MENTYVLNWTSKSRGATGRGKKLFSREEAQQIAKELNEDYPDFVHEPFNLALSTSLSTESSPAMMPAQPLLLVDFQA